MIHLKQCVADEASADTPGEPGEASSATLTSTLIDFKKKKIDLNQYLSLFCSFSHRWETAGPSRSKTQANMLQLFLQQIKNTTGQQWISEKVLPPAVKSHSVKRLCRIKRVVTGTRRRESITPDRGTPVTRSCESVRKQRIKTPAARESWAVSGQDRSKPWQSNLTFFSPRSFCI